MEISLWCAVEYEVVLGVGLALGTWRGIQMDFKVDTSSMDLDLPIMCRGEATKTMVSRAVSCIAM